MDSPAPNIALVYYDDAYVEPQPAASVGAAAGIYGRHVAGKEFLHALIGHGRQEKIVAVCGPNSIRSLTEIWDSHPAHAEQKRDLQIVNEADFHKSFFPDPPATLVHLPCPPVARYAWARQHGGPGSFAISGITHTLCPASLVHDLCELVTAPYEPCDALICTSRSAEWMVRAVTTIYADYLRDRFGGEPGLRVQLPVIPLGVSSDKFRPPLPEERSVQRKMFHVADDEVAVLFVGRLSFHGKAHPFPMFRGLAEAARKMGRKVHLLLSGWTSNPSVMTAFSDGGRDFAPGVRVSILDGVSSQARFRVWQAADIFTSLSDNLQETFGLTVIEAMASGLPVVASDWDGYRDLVVPGETGYLIPTCMVRGATTDVTSRLVFGEISYDQFMAETNQAVAVDLSAAGAAYVKLIGDASLRLRMGAAGRQRVLERFTWPRVVAAYEELWRGQERERRALAGRAGPSRGPGIGPAIYPAPEEAYANWPTAWLTDTDRVQSVAGTRDLLEQLRTMPLTNYLDGSRSNDPKALNTVLRAAESPRALTDLVDIMQTAGMAPLRARATLAWMLKYGLLQRV